MSLVDQGGEAAGQAWLSLQSVSEACLLRLELA